MNVWAGVWQVPALAQQANSRCLIAWQWQPDKGLHQQPHHRPITRPNNSAAEQPPSHLIVLWLLRRL
jgi:hypothetical protein